ncbi:MAG TPA: adenylate/guanylate cyclase domain-containing protein [Acidimicrobiales bacterium]|nr:adenylate/guanylate cyclase domain-containing protein [Acidimicrobiales bacterium]
MGDVDLPEGVVTFLFTDIEGSTRLLQSAPERYGEILEAHRKVIREGVAANGGHEVKTDGDGFFIVFRSPTAAVTAAAAAQRGLASDALLLEYGVTVRMGLHTGEAQVTAGDYLGLAVHHAARVGSAGHGGQVVVSEATRLMTDADVPVDFIDLGEHLLKDLARPIRLFQLRADGLRVDFLPIRSLNAATATLPTSRTSFVGREPDLKRLLIALDEPGLVTLTGPGGTGKTRLAIEAARELRHAMDGTWFVDLQSASEPAQVAARAAAALDVLDASQPDTIMSRLTERIGQAACLIVLDNCEHLVEPAAELAERLLSDCPELRLLATSRDLLGLADERALRIPPLDLESATELFVDRAARADPGFAPSDDDLDVIRTICQRLDGIPLAVELAATRVRHMPVEDLAARLGDMFRLLVGSPGRGLQRHQTLQAVVDWSYDLLNGEEQAVFRRLSVLAGRFGVAEAEAVVRDDSITSSIAEVVFRLVDRSLLEHDGHGRYRQLETLRAYGQDKLLDAGESEATRERHAVHFLALAETADAGLIGGDFLEALDRLEADAENLQTALEWAAADDDKGLALRLVAASAVFAAVTSRAPLITVASRVVSEATGEEEFLAAAQAALGIAASCPGWERRLVGHAAATMELLGQETDQPEDADHLRAWALVGLAIVTALTGEAPSEALVYAARAETLATRGDLPMVAAGAGLARGWERLRAGDVTEARRLLAEVLDGALSRPETLWFAVARFWSGIAAMRAEEWTEALGHYAEVLPTFRRVSHKLYVQWVLDHMSYAALSLDDLPAARAYAEEGITTSADSGLGEGSNLYLLLERLGLLEALRGDATQAAHYYERAIALVNPDRGPHDYAALVANLASARAQSGELDEARRHAREAIDVIGRLEDVTLPTGAVQPPPIGNALRAVARLALAAGKPREAAELAGAVVAIHPLDKSPAHAREYVGRFHDALAEALGGSEQLAKAMAKGAEMPDPLSRAREVLSAV